MNPNEPGWYPDPDGSGQDRWWDGSNYTPQTRPSEGGSAPTPPSGDQPGWATQPTTAIQPGSIPPPPSGGGGYGQPGGYGPGPSGPGTPPPAPSGPGYGQSTGGGYGQPGFGQSQSGPGYGQNPQDPYGGAPAPPFGTNTGPGYQAPGYGTGTPPPGGPPTPATKSKAPWIVGGIVAVVALCCSGILLFSWLGNDGNTTTTTTRAGVTTSAQAATTPSTSSTTTSTTRPPTTTTTIPTKEYVSPLGFKFTHPNWSSLPENNGYTVWAISPKGSDPTGGVFAVKEDPTPPAQASFDGICTGLGGQVETLPVGPTPTKFCKYIKDAKYVQWEGYNVWGSKNVVTLIRYQGTKLADVPALPDSVKQVLASTSAA